MEINKYNKIINYLQNIIKGTQFEDHVFSVGGCERDKYLKNEIKDIDLVVDLPNGGINFANFIQEKGYTKGSVVVYENFGTAMFTLSKFPDIELEAVQTRKECYRDLKSRNPETAYGTILDDCHRRDFTINSLYHNISTNEDIDLTGMGIKDIESKIIRTCGDPNIIFSEDPLRILRCIRFAERLSFNIEKDTMKGMCDYADRLSIISKERINDELTKIINTNTFCDGFKLFEKIKLFEQIFGFNLKINYKWLKKYQKTFTNINEKYIGVMTLLIYNYNDKINEILKDSLKVSNDIFNKINLFVNLLLLVSSLNKKDRNEALTRYITYKLKDINEFKEFNTIIEAMGFKLKNISNKEYMFNYKLPINGNEISEILGIKPCKLVGDIISSLNEVAFKFGPFLTKEECIFLIKHTITAKKIEKDFLETYKIIKKNKS